VRMKIAERAAVWRRERRVLLRVSGAAWRLEQAERERSWALASARAEGVSIRAFAADVDKLARARQVQDLTTAAVLPDPRAERRRRLAEPDLEFRAFCTRRRLPASSTPRLERAWDAWQAERY